MAAPENATAAVHGRLRLWRGPLSRLTPVRRTVKSQRGSLRYWWLLARDSAQRYHVCHHETSEAALLQAARRVNPQAYADIAEEIWWNPVSSRGLEDATRDLTSVMHEDVEIGMQFHVASADDLGPISERVFAVQAPSSAFLEDYSSFKQAIRGHRATRGVPVRLNLDLARLNFQRRVFLLREILQLVMAQQLMEVAESVDANALVASRFRIVELRINSTAINAEAVSYLTRLCQRGIRIRSFVPIQEEGDPLESPVTVTQAIRVLISPLHGRTTQECRPNRVLVSLDASPRQNAASKLKLETMWRWAAYALLSRYAQHHVERIVIDTKVLDDDAVAVAKEVLTANDPLALLFETSLSQRSHGWLSANRFYMAPPDAARTGPPVVFESLVSIRVQTIETREEDGKKWWRVLLPGCGDAWVRDGDVQALVTEDSTGFPGSRTNTVRHLKFVDMTGTSKDTVLEFMRLAPHGIKVIEVSASDEEFPIDDWLSRVLSVCTELEELILPRNADLRGLGEIVAAAEADNVRLRRLTVGCVITVGNSPDVLDFLDVLCDPTHQLTSHLQELRLVVDLYNEPNDFAVRFRQLLETNRQIYSLRLLVYGAKFRVPTFEHVVIGGCPAPLDMRSKVALIAALSMRSSQLDSSVTGLIFSFAAQHRVREVDVEFTGVYYREDY